MSDSLELLGVKGLKLPPNCKYFVWSASLSTYAFEQPGSWRPRVVITDKDGTNDRAWLPIVAMVARHCWLEEFDRLHHKEAIAAHNNSFKWAEVARRAEGQQ